MRSDKEGVEKLTRVPDAVPPLLKAIGVGVVTAVVLPTAIPAFAAGMGGYYLTRHYMRKRDDKIYG